MADELHDMSLKRSFQLLRGECSIEGYREARGEAGNPFGDQYSSSSERRVCLDPEGL